MVFFFYALSCQAQFFAIRNYFIFMSAVQMWSFCNYFVQLHSGFNLSSLDLFEMFLKM